jgi:Colicin D/Pretoxin HINT domain
MTAKGWVGMGSLGIGTEILTRAGPRLVVKSIKQKHFEDGVKVYNFTVDDKHTYFVGDSLGGAWVHNAPCDIFSSKTGVNYTHKKLQHEFKHASDFGIGSPNFNPTLSKAFMQAIDDHIHNAWLKKPGKYRGQLVDHYFDPVTNLWAAVDMNGDFVAGWKLSDAQVSYLATTGNIN